MTRAKLSDTHGGWFVGDFPLAVHRTQDFEAAVHSFPRGYCAVPHYHLASREINVLISGRLRVDGDVVEPGDIFIYEPGDVADVHFLKDSTVLIVRTRSLPGDKYFVQPKD
jgi:mannose-6-phosphate isomerase-like protein (cupin superfamily)